MNMPSLHLIGSFLAFVDAKNMNEAAKSLGLSQPALSLHLKQFEVCFEHKVFTQVGRKKVLTSYGIELRDVLSKRFSGLDRDLKSVGDRHLRPGEIEVHIAGRAELLNFLAPHLNFPGRLIFVEMDSDKALKGVSDRSFDFAIASREPEDDSLHARRLFHDRFQLVAPSKWLEGHSSLTQGLLREICARPYLSYKESDLLLADVLHAHKQNSGPKTSRVLASWPVLIDMIERGMGWTLAPSRYQPHSKKASVLSLPGAHAKESPYFLVYRSEMISLPWFKELVGEIRRVWAPALLADLKLR